MADVRPFRALRYDAARADPARDIAPPYDVISPALQADLYRRSAENIVRVEYGEVAPGDDATNNRYTRAARDLAAWRAAGALIRDAQPSIYAYQQEYEWDGATHVRHHYFAVVRLEAWDAGVIKPHEHTLSGPKADRLELLRATRTQVSPVYCLYRSRDGASAPHIDDGEALYDAEADGQRHIVSAISAISDAAAIDALAAYWRYCDVYIADGHHRYETALAYRNECRERATSWTGEEPENFVLMALTDAGDPGLLVLPTHRLVNPPSMPPDALQRIERHCTIEDLGDANADSVVAAIDRLSKSGAHTAFVALGVPAGRAHLITLKDCDGIDRLMPSQEPEAWKRLDVSVLQYGILRDVFGIDDAALAAGREVTYTQDAAEAAAAVADGRARCAFLLNATPVDQVLAVADAGGRMPQKSTYFYPKLPTGLVMNALDA